MTHAARRSSTLRICFAGAALGAILAVAMAPARTASALQLHHRPLIAVGASQSNNWSGYNQGTLEKNGTLFHQVSGDWVVPTATQRVANQAESSATWVGIGGGRVDSSGLVGDNTLIQAGTSQDVDASGKASYTAWWEIIPAPSIPISLPVSAGNHVHVDVHETTPGMWSITINNVSTGGSFNMTTPYTSTYGTAEWIEETPVVVDSSGNVSVGPMPNLSTVTFDQSQANNAAANLNASEAIQLVDFNGAVLETPSAPDVDFDGFNDCAFASSCSAPTSS
ncbi:MAG: hypothetical protein E6J14_09760 [Chloroflexi bacterium]|nr:MAG: hypothetical protein E6J14_09760 [Chloroflexota bacterium]